MVLLEPWEFVPLFACLAFLVVGFGLFLLTVVLQGFHFFGEDASIDHDHDLGIDADHDVGVGLDHDPSIEIDTDVDIELDHDLSVDLDHEVSLDHDVGVEAGSPLDQFIGGLDKDVPVDLHDSSPAPFML